MTSWQRTWTIRFLLGAAQRAGTRAEFEKIAAPIFDLWREEDAARASLVNL